VARKHEVLAAITEVLDDAQLTYVIEHGGKHLHIIFVVNGRKRRFICSESSSTSWRAVHAARTQTKRMIRECHA
jgi:hypothetical protein